MASRPRIGHTPSGAFRRFRVTGPLMAVALTVLLVSGAATPAVDPIHRGAAPIGLLRNGSISEGREAPRPAAEATPAWYALTENRSPSANYAAATAYDAADGYTLLYGGCIPGGLDNLFCVPSNQTWALEAGEWTPINSTLVPPALSTEAMAWDPVDGYVLMVGGVGSSPLGVPDTWSYLHGEWTNRSTASGPPSTESSALVYDPELSAMLYYGGSCNVTWTYRAGLWTHLNLSEDACPGPASVEMAYDPPEQEVVLFGGGGLGEPLGTWAFANGSWTNITGSVQGSPPPNVFGTMAYDPLDGYLVLYGGASAELLPTYYTTTWSFSGDRWTNLTGAAGLGADPTYGSAVFDPGEGDLILYGGHAFGGVGGNSWAYGEPPLQAQWTGPNPLRTDVGAATSIRFSLSGGGTGTTASLSGAPTSGTCTSASRSGGTFGSSCTFSAVGDQTFGGTVKDDRANGTSLPNLTVEVGPVLTVGLVGATSVGSGARLSLDIRVAGGWPPYTLQASSLPSGCTGLNGTWLNCTPSGSGTYALSVAVTDAAHVTSYANATIHTGVSALLPGGTSTLIVVLLVTVVAVVLAAVVLTRRKRGRQSSASAPAEPTPMDPGDPEFREPDPDESPPE